MNTTPAPSQNRQWDVDATKDWIVSRAKPLSFIGGGIVVLIAVVLFWRQSDRLKNERADAALATAQSAFYSGNPTLAKSDLQKLVTRYPGTSGAAQAVMLLAQVMYGESRHDDGIKELTAAAGSAPAQFVAAIEELIASGYADTKRYDDAASHFLKAAERTTYSIEKDVFRADAARMYQLAGKTAEARKLWEPLAANRESPVLNEAKVRLGEIDSKAASK